MSIKTIILTAFLALTATSVFARDVYVNGYYRSDGTYVQPHYRSAPDNSRSNNYGSSSNSYERLNPYTRDKDRDGTPNYLDWDDDNNGWLDDYDQ